MNLKTLTLFLTGYIKATAAQYPDGFAEGSEEEKNAVTIFHQAFLETQVVTLQVRAEN